MKNKNVIIIVSAIIIIIAIVLIVIFSKKGSKNNNKTGIITTTTTFTQEKQEEKEATEVKLGEVVENDCIKMTLDKFEVEPEYKFRYEEQTSVGKRIKNNGIDCKSGMKLVCLRGKLTNKTSKEVYTGNSFVKGEITINGNTYTTTLKCFDTEHAESYSTMIAQQEAEYFLYAEVPQNIADNIENCTIKFGNVNDLDPSKYVSNINVLDYLYSLQVK